MSVLRAFIAIEIPVQLREKLYALASSFAQVHPGTLRIVPAENLHLTLKFLGSVETGRIADITTALHEIAGHTEPIAYHSHGGGCFPERGLPSIVWSGVRKVTTLERCFEIAEDVCEGIGIRREPRPYTPHVTIARVRADKTVSGIRALVECASWPSDSFDVEHFTLFRSHLSPSGTIYEPIERVRI